MSPPPHPASYYAATANPFPTFAPLAGEVRADVCVVGGGYAGVSAALHLAERGYDVVLLEGARIGWGASGRNGGQIVSGFAASMTAIEKAVGRADARRLWDMAEEAKAMIRERVARHRIACDLKPGYLFAALKRRHMAELREWKRSLEDDYGYDGLELVDADRIGEVVAAPGYVGGLLDRGGGHLHPLNYCLGLAGAAVEAGVRIFEDSRVVALDTAGAPVARTARGAVRARHLVLCGNAYLGDLVPRLRARVMPVGTYIGATRPLGEERARALIPGDIAVADVNFVLNYFRLSADRRMLFGGRVSYSTVEPPNLARAMGRLMARTFPQLAGEPLEYAWGGFVAITIERTPHLGRLDGEVYFAQGFSGHGVALTGLAGKVIAEAIAGTAERFDLFARLPHRPFPGGRALRMPLLVLAMLYYRLRDLL